MYTHTHTRCYIVTHKGDLSRENPANLGEMVLSWGPSRKPLCKWHHTCSSPSGEHNTALYTQSTQGFIPKVGALFSPSLNFPPRKLENMYSLVLMQDAVAVPHKLLPHPPPKKNSCMKPWYICNSICPLLSIGIVRE